MTKSKQGKYLEKLKTTFKDKLLAYLQTKLPLPEKTPLKEKSGKEKEVAIINDIREKEKVQKLIKPFIENKEISEKLMVLPLSILWEAIRDGKYSLLISLLTGKIIYDSGFIKVLKACETLKVALKEKLERYVMSIILMGSIAQGRATEESDIDVAVIVDDTDLKRMSREEARKRLRFMINAIGREISQKFETIQVYLLTDVWEWIKDANPVIFTIIRDGVPIYDKGLFNPWRLLLKQGKITPSAEAIHRFQEASRIILRLIESEMTETVIEKLYQAMVMPSQAALMLYGVMPMAYWEVADMLRNIFVKDEKMLEEKYVEWVEDIIKIRKAVEHGKIKQVSPEEFVKQLKRAKEFQERMTKLYDQIRKEKIKDKVNEMESMIKRTIIKFLTSKGITSTKDPIEKFENYIKKTDNKELLDFIIEWNRIKTANKNGKLTSADVQLIYRKVLDFIANVERL